VEALREFILSQGASKNVTYQEWDKIWTINKKLIDPVCPRHTAVVAAGKVLLTLEGEWRAAAFLQFSCKLPASCDDGCLMCMCTICLQRLFCGAIFGFHITAAAAQVLPNFSSTHKCCAWITYVL
jgi:hypothetical protein